jgi:cell division protein FtsB
MMITKHRRKSALNRLWMPLLTAAFLGYFGFHAFHGYYGIWSRDRLEVDAAALRAELERLKDERAAFERRVDRLRSDKLDADLIDIEARVALNRIRPDEVVLQIITQQQ